MEWHSQVRQAYDELRVVPPAVLSGSFSPPLLHCKAAHPEQFPLSGLVKKQEAESLEPGGKQDQDTGDLFLISTSLTGRSRFCSWTCVLIREYLSFHR